MEYKIEISRSCYGVIDFELKFHNPRFRNGYEASDVDTDDITNATRDFINLLKQFEAKAKQASQANG